MSVHTVASARPTTERVREVAHHNGEYMYSKHRYSYRGVLRDTATEVVIWVCVHEHRNRGHAMNCAEFAANQHTGLEEACRKNHLPDVGFGHLPGGAKCKCWCHKSLHDLFASAFGEYP